MSGRAEPEEAYEPIEVLVRIDNRMKGKEHYEGIKS